jgi:serine phosphatase RsbU (regulator of sigma subunit)
MRMIWTVPGSAAVIPSNRGRPHATRGLGLTGNEEFLREKAKLLIARERELLALRRKHRRLALWASLAHALPELADPKAEPAEACRRVSERMVSLLDLQRVAFFEMNGASLSPMAGQGAPGTAFDLGGPVEALIAEAQSGACFESSGEAQRSFCDAVGLQRFLWHRLTPAGGPSVLCVAGYDRERAVFYAPFDEDDVAHFGNTARQLALLLGNNNLVRELERDKSRLHQFNLELERRVEERTSELAASNRDLERALSSLRSKDRRLEEDIEEARLFQQRILTDAPRSAVVDFATVYQPLERVGGDVFDVCELRPNVYRVFVADATGHGVQASMRTILIKTEYDRLKTVCDAPHLLLQELNRRLVALFPGGEIMCTGCCVDVVVGGEGAEASYANAGGPPIVHWSAGGAEAIYGDSPFLGVLVTEWPEPTLLRMSAGDVLLVASDGLAEQRNGRGDVFEASLEGVARKPVASAAELANSLMADLTAFRSETPIADDVTFVVLRLPAGSAGVTNPG